MSATALLAGGSFDRFAFHANPWRGENEGGLVLAAEPMLEAAFLRPETSRLLVVTLAYVWAVLGMFYVGTPYVLRDQIAWLSKSPQRWTGAAIAGLAYGIAVLGAGLVR